MSWDFVKQVDSAGFAIVSPFLEPDSIARLERALPTAVGEMGGLRNLLNLAEVAELAESPNVRAVVSQLLGSNARPVRAMLFDKTPVANWKVTWHQDLSIAVKQRVDAPGYGPWSDKAGVVHVQPPVEVLESMLAVRFHLDPSDSNNGPLRVLPGSHGAGKLRDAEIPTWTRRIAEHVCLVPRGGALLMRPLLLHASSVAREPTHRRVIHIEYAGCDLASGLQWRWARDDARAA